MKENLCYTKIKKMEEVMQRFKATKMASFLGIFFNLFLFVIKFIASVITSSQAMMADAINSLSDAISSLLIHH